MPEKIKVPFLCRIGLHSDTEKPLYSLQAFKDNHLNEQLGYTRTCDRCKRRIKVLTGKK